MKPRANLAKAVSQQRKWRKWVRGIALALATFLIVGCIVAVIVARMFFHGANLAMFIEDRVNKKIRGRIEIGSVEWPLSQAHRAVTGGWVDVTIHDVEVWDYHGDLVGKTERLTGKVKGRDLLLFKDYVFKDLRMPDGGWVLIKEEFEPYPTYDHEITVVTLISAFFPKVRPPGPEHPESLAAKSTWDVSGIVVENLELDLEFPDFTGKVEGAGGKAWIYYAKPEGRGEDVVAFSYELENIKAPTGLLTIQNLAPIRLRDINVPAVAKKQPDVPKQNNRSKDMRFTANARTPEGARFEVTGAMLDYWMTPHGGTYDVLVLVENVGGLLETLSYGIVGGAHAEASIVVGGLRVLPDYRVTLVNVDGELEPVQGKPAMPLHIEKTTVTYSKATSQGELLDTQIEVAGGAVAASGNYTLSELRPPAYALDLAVNGALQLEPWIDANTARLTGGTRLDGRLSLHSTHRGVRFEKLDLRLGATRVKGAVEYGDDRIVHTDNVRVEQGETWAISKRGVVDLEKRFLDLPLTFRSNNLRPWLRRFRQPAIARRAEGTAHVKGAFDDIQVPDGTLNLSGVPVVGKATADFSYAHGTLTVDGARASPFGGELSGNAKIKLSGRRPAIEELRVSGMGFDLSKTPGMKSLLAGTGSFHLSAQGPLDAPVSTFGADVDELRIAGDDYSGFLLSGSTDPDRSASLQFHVDRQRGGRMDINTTITPDGDIGGIVSMREIPLQTLPGVLDENGKASFGGIADAELALNGTVGAPTADGAVTATRGWFKQSFLGSAELTVERAGPGQMRVAGSMFQGKFAIDGIIQTAPSLAIKIDVDFRRIELDQFFPELAETYGLRGWMSGRFEDLTLEPGKAPTFTAHMTELVILMDNEDERGRPHPIKARSSGDVVVSYDGVRAQLLAPAVFRGPTGTFTVVGFADPESIEVHVEGTVDVALLQPYLRTVFAEARGSVGTSVDITGSPANPQLTGILDVDSVRLRPIGQDAEIRIPLAKIQVTNRAVIFTNFNIQVHDEIVDEVSTLSVKGAVAMEDFVPTNWGLNIEGKLSGKLLQLAAPDTFTAAGGTANLELDFLGVGVMPDISGKLSFGVRNPLTFTPRGLRREILINRGQVTFDDQDIELVALGGTIDDSGNLVDVSGELSLDDWSPQDIDINLVAEGLPFRFPQVLELELDVTRFRIVGDASGLDIIGELDIIDGRYIQKFNPLLSALKPERVRETEIPIYEEVALIANSRLDLRVTTGGGFGIKNNIADIDLDGEVRLRGTPARPEIDGEIQVVRGSFKFQGMRAQFDQTEGNIVFSRFKNFPDDNPTIDVRSESAYLDTRGNDHDVVLTLSGTLTNLNWDLFTRNTGLNKSQTFTLLFSGRTTEENRSLLGDTAVDSAGSFDGSKSTARTEGNIGAFDQLAKDYLGDFISVLVEEPLRNATGIDIIRIEVGTSGVGGRVEERFGNNSRFVTEFERTLDGYTLSAELEHQLTDRWSLAAEYLSKQFFDTTDENVSAGRGKVGVKGKVGE